MNRIDECFAHAAARCRKCFVAYVVAGDPNLVGTERLVLKLAAAGVDIIELGVPFSDPLADGVVNQLGAQRALESGTTLSGIFSCVSSLRQQSEVPVVLFTYYNPVFRYGLERFLSAAMSAGVDGALILDLPPEEARREWPQGDAFKRISLIAPTTPESRIKQICEAASGFIYYVSREGVTGMQNELPVGLTENLALIRRYTSLPVCVGFGVSNPDQAGVVARAGDGVVVGSAIVNEVGRLAGVAGWEDRVVDLVRPMVEAVHAV